MKKIIALIIALVVAISSAPAISADTLSQGKFTVTRNMGSGTGTIHIEMYHPAESISINGLEMEVILPEGFSFGGNISTPLSKWEIKQSKSYSVGSRYARKLYVSNPSSALPNNGATVTVAKIPVSFAKSLKPGEKNVLINISDIAINVGGETVSGLDYFEKNSEGEYSYSSNFKYSKSIESATVSGITDQPYNRGFRVTPKPTVKLDGTTLAPNSEYTVRYSNNTKCGLASVIIQGMGNYTGSITKTFYIIPEAISDITYSDYTVSQIKVNWKTTTNADGYYVYRSLQSNSGYSVIKTITSGKTSSYTDTGLLSGTKYYYKIQAYKNINGKKMVGALTPSTKYRVTAGYTINTTSGLKESAKTSSSITLKWNKTLAATDNKVVSGYYIYRSTTSGSGYKRVATISDGNTLTYKDTGLSAGSTYYYRVQPYRTYKGAAGVGGYVSLSAKTLAKPGTVTGLKKSSVKAGSLKLSWSGVSAVSGYEVYHSLKSGSGYSLIKTTTAKSFTHSGLYSGVNNYFKVRAYRNEDGKKVYGSYSSVLSVKAAGYKVPKPTKLKMASNSTTGIKLSWKKVSKASGYYIYRSTSKTSGFKKVNTIKKGSTVSFSDKKLTAGKTYYYRVVAYRTYKGSNGIGEYASITAGTKTKAPKVSLKKASKTSIKITSKKVTGASGYQVYYSTKKSSGFKKAYSGSKTTYTKKKLIKGKKYYVKVRAYKTIGGKQYYSSYSSVNSIKL